MRHQCLWSLIRSCFILMGLCTQHVLFLGELGGQGANECVLIKCLWLLQYQQIIYQLVVRATVSTYTQTVICSRSYQISGRKQEYVFKGCTGKNCKWELLVCWFRIDQEKKGGWEQNHGGWRSVQLRRRNCDNHLSSFAEWLLELEFIAAVGWLKCPACRSHHCTNPLACGCWCSCETLQICF